jgi:hypothetical protein
VTRIVLEFSAANLKAICSAMQKLAKAYQPPELAHDAYRLHQRFRPAIPEGVPG